MTIQENIKCFKTLETNRLTLRKLLITDIKDMFEYGSDFKVSEFVMWNKYETLEDAKNFADIIINKYEKGNDNFWAIELKENSKMIGTINFVDFKRKYNWAELGYVLNRNYWSSGIMTEAIKKIIQYGFEELDLNKIQAKCIKENIGSYKAMEKVGMKLDGVLRQHMMKKEKYVDLVSYSILRDEFHID